MVTASSAAMGNAISVAQKAKRSKVSTSKARPEQQARDGRGPAQAKDKRRPEAEEQGPQAALARAFPEDVRQRQHQPP